MRLIIIDDDLQTVEVVRDSINWKLFDIDDVEIAFNVHGAQKLFLEKTPDVVICDIEMPKASGIDLLKWVRDNKFKTEFIFFTCHESFEFASIALNHDVISYIIKPFNIDKIEMAVSKAVDKIRKENSLQEYKQYGEYWLENKKLIQGNFWQDIVFMRISSNPSIIAHEIANRKLVLNMSDTYHMVVVSVLKSQSENMPMDTQLFEYSLKKICSEILLDELYFEHTFHYDNNRNHFVVVIMKADMDVEDIKIKGSQLIKAINHFLKCMVACYISDKVNISELASVREVLEGMDQNNFGYRNKIFMQGDDSFLAGNNHDIIDTKTMTELFQEYQKIEIANTLKKELELLTVKNSLNASVMHAIHQDFMQVVYAFLYKKGIQAHKLLSDKISRQLHENAENSVFDMMKWVNHITNRTIDYAKEVEKSMSIIEKVKHYIHENYQENISKNEVSAVVFLTPDYLAKIFIAEEGISIKSYINQCRITRAKELLKTSDYSISFIASEVGFDNISYFSTIFKKIVGMSPYVYKEEEK